MTGRLVLVVLMILVIGSPGLARAEGLDWDPCEEEARGLLKVLRHKRDGLLGFLDNALDLQLGLFSEVAMLAGSALILTADVVGLVDDNPITEHVTRAIISKSLAKTAYLFHVVGAEAILGSHGLAVEWYLEESMSQVNPLLDSESSGPALPLHPLAFVGEAWFHTEPLTFRAPGAIALTAVLSNAFLRPIGNVFLILDLEGPALRFEEFGNELVRRAAP